MKRNTKQTIKYYWQSIVRHKLSLAVILLMILADSLVEIVAPLWLKKFVDLLNAGVRSDQVVASLMGIVYILVLLKFGQLIVRRISDFAINFFESKIIAELSDRCFAYLHRHSFSFFNNNFVGSLTKKFKWFTSAFEAIVDNVFWNILPLIVEFSFIIVILFSYNIYFGSAAILWILVFVLANIIFNRAKIKHDIKKNELETKTTGILADTITNQTNVKLFNGYEREVASYASANEDLRRIRLFSWNIWATFNGFQSFLIMLLELGFLFYAVPLWRDGRLTVGDFVLIQSYIAIIISHLWNFGKIIMRVYENLANAEEMTEVLLLAHEIKDAPGAKKLKVPRGQIEFKQVGFNYNETRNILHDFDLTVKAGERLAIIGSSGAGKTTVIKLLLRMHDLTAGKILVDGQNIAKVTQESLWRNIALVPQDPILFHRTLRENIAYGIDSATDKEIINAAKAANCHEFISGFPDGYNTFVGERGIKLSGGERQRVAIARAILKNAPILVMDEATSSLDSESERLIQGALNNLMKGKTVIVIAHRLSTIKKMNRIIVLENGRIIEEGSHELLSKKKGVYRKLWEIQAEGFSV